MTSQSGEIIEKREEEEEEEEEEDKTKKKTGSTLTFSTGTAVIIDPLKDYFDSIIDYFQKKVTDIKINYQNDEHIYFSIPSSFVPVTLRVAFGFYEDDILFDINIRLKNYSWTTQPLLLTISNPISDNYCGKALVSQAKDNFFSEKFDTSKKITDYRSAPFFLRTENDTDPEVLKTLQKQGYTRAQSIRAASLCNNDIEKIGTFLQTGQYTLDSSFSCQADYNDCPLLYFVLEIFDAILNLQDHCAMCGKQITPGLRANICDDANCQLRFVDIGVGMTLCKEIRKDPLVADLLFSIFSATFKTEFFDPKPILPKNKTLDEIIEKMPKMNKIGNQYDDSFVSKMIGIESFDILKWVILTCRSNFLLLPSDLEFQQFKNRTSRCFQFMAMTGSPERESIFQQMKKVYGSRFLWHGSPTVRWHRIIRQGLKNLSNTPLMGVGAVFGEGIYFAKSSLVSLNYCRTSENFYKNTDLGKNPKIIALCEVINLPLGEKVDFEVEVNGSENKKEKKMLSGVLKDHGDCLTLTMDEACIIRFVFVGLSNTTDINVADRPPKNIPTLDQVLKKRAQIQ